MSIRCTLGSVDNGEALSDRTVATVPSLRTGRETPVVRGNPRIEA